MSARTTFCSVQSGALERDIAHAVPERICARANHSAESAAHTAELTLLAAIGIDGEGAKHPLGLLEGATENAAVVQALLDNLIQRGLDPKLCRLFIVDRSKALIKATRRPFGRRTPIQRCHKARNIVERLP